MYKPSTFGSVLVSCLKGNGIVQKEAYWEFRLLTESVSINQGDRPCLVTIVYFRAWACRIGESDPELPPPWSSVLVTKPRSHS